MCINQSLLNVSLCTTVCTCMLRVHVLYVSILFYKGTRRSPFTQRTIGLISPSFYAEDALISGDMYMNEKYERMCLVNSTLERDKMNQDAVVRRLQHRVEQLGKELQLCHEEKGRLIVSLIMGTIIVLIGTNV